MAKYNINKVSERVMELCDLADDIEIKLVRSDENYKGRINLGTGLIKLNVNYSPEIIQTLIHELIHYDNYENKCLVPNYQEEVGTEDETQELSENFNNIIYVNKYLQNRDEIKPHKNFCKYLEQMINDPFYCKM